MEITKEFTVHELIEQLKQDESLGDDAETRSMVADYLFPCFPPIANSEHRINASPAQKYLLK